MHGIRRLRDDQSADTQNDEKRLLILIEIAYGHDTNNKGKNQQKLITLKLLVVGNDFDVTPVVTHDSPCISGNSTL